MKTLSFILIILTSLLACQSPSPTPLPIILQNPAPPAALPAAPPAALPDQEQASPNSERGFFDRDYKKAAENVLAQGALNGVSSYLGGNDPKTAAKNALTEGLKGGLNSLLGKETNTTP